MKSRHFNKLKVNRVLGTITKTSKDDKILNEINYIQSLPSELAPLFPRVIDHWTGPHHSYTMEFYGYPTLADSMIKNTSFDWNKAFHRLDEVLFLFWHHRKEQTREDHNAFYIDKFVNRVEEFLSFNKDFDRETFVINGRTTPGIRKILGKVTDLLGRLYDPEHHYMMHGDLIFGNILCDPRQQIIRLIDPRGSFGSHVGIYGDHRYDLAKLYQSGIGGYDYIINEMFRITLSDGRVDYEIQSTPDAVVNGCRMLATRFADEDEVMFIMATLFLSMVPLHTEDPIRQRILFAHGLNLINKLI